MKFSEALKELECGGKLKRSGWNGKTQYIILGRMLKCELADGKVIECPPHMDIENKFIMFVGTHGYQCGWLASQADMLADDWELIK